MILRYSDLGLRGRLGNALYELAATLGVAATLGAEARFLPSWTHRPFFSVPPEYFSDEPGEEAWTCGLLKHIDERARPYMQDYSLFADIMPTLREFLKPSPAARDLILEHGSRVIEDLPRPILAVHVRRGDNVVDPGVPDKWRYHPCPPLEYYEKAIAEFRPYVRSVAAFGDDYAWNVANIEANYHHRGVARPKEHEADFLKEPVLDFIDFQLLRFCDYHVLSNSTFGMFAALLRGDDRRPQMLPGVEPRTKAIVPWPIYGPALDYIDANLMLNPTWRKMP